jgi:hypothetical protein
MFRKHVDFIAVFFIAVALLAFSQLSSLRVPDFGDSIQLQKALVNSQSCPTARAVLTHVFNNLDN